MILSVFWLFLFFAFVVNVRNFVILGAKGDCGEQGLQGYFFIFF
jgi:hypothetical protein